MESDSQYKRAYYSKRHEKTVYSANTILNHVLPRLPNLDSAVDFGCGVGTWLSIIIKHHTCSILGLDGEWIDRDLLQIPFEKFKNCDLSQPVRLEKKYTLAISLEVAEHLPPESAADFVESLCKAATFVIFSAAVPGQLGKGHVNTQWPKYWAEHFRNNNFECLDIIRSHIWEDERIPVYYRQNCLLFADHEKIGEISILNEEKGKIGTPISLVHPKLLQHRIEWLENRIAKMKTFKGSFHQFLRTCKRIVLNREQ